jgi:G3E family GTPase
VWLAARGDLAATVSQAGPSIQFGPAGYWLATLPEDQQQEVLETEPDVKAKWDEQWGDRLNEVVFIGVGMNRADIEARLDRCLLTEEEMKQDWSTFNNPLPWPAEELLAAAGD